MNNYFSINTFSDKVSVPEEIEEGNIISISITSYSIIGIDEGDNFVFLDNKFYSTDGYNFTYYGTVISIKIVSIPELNTKDEKINKYVFTIDLQVKGKVRENGFLEELKFSLTKVYNFYQPYRHFLRPYSRLTRNDYYTIIKGDIIIERTVFGSIILALDDFHKEQFLMYAVDEDPSIINSNNYRQAYLLLKDYLDYTVITPGRYLLEISEIINENFDDMTFEDLGIINDIENENGFRRDTGDSFFSLIQIFQKNTNYLTESNFLNIIEEQFELREDYSGFSNITSFLKPKNGFNYYRN